MTRCIVAAALALACVVPAAAQDRLARFEGGIGVIPTGSTNTTVRGVAAAGQMWVIDRLSADIRVDGRISVDGRGLLFGAGNNVGFTGGVSVIATLLCQTSPTTFSEHSTDPNNGVLLEPNGDFRIEQMLTTVPAECANPVLLIRNAQANAAGVRGWFAAGIPKL